ncbi:hypothetical protein L596_028310 [Steinernema carpocapsae]|uniref:Homeobox domain-containing protein n=1 Tax=Steinernema carpocapsae TaxID=34508 RepID=A0A4U5LY45_STECR|nr:hypothetical protein L596_028310 [Steinernema carpocapsae]
MASFTTSSRCGNPALAEIFPLERRMQLLGSDVTSLRRIPALEMLRYLRRLAWVQGMTLAETMVWARNGCSQVGCNRKLIPISWNLVTPLESEEDTLIEESDEDKVESSSGDDSLEEEDKLSDGHSSSDDQSEDEVGQGSAVEARKQPEKENWNEEEEILQKLFEMMPQPSDERIEAIAHELEWPTTQVEAWWFRRLRTFMFD